MKILLNSLYKGGIGKTTQNYIFSNLLVNRGYKVLFMDFDPQMSATRLLTRMMKDAPEFQEKNVFEAMKSDDLQSNIIKFKPNLDFIPGNKLVNLFEDIMIAKNIDPDKYHLYLKAIFQPLVEKDEYDFILLDMSPSKSKLNISVMTAATHHIVVSQSEVLSMDMIDDYIEDIDELKKEHKVDTTILGISIGMRDSNKISKSVVETIKAAYPNLSFKTVTKRKTRIQEFVVTGFPEKNARGVMNMEDSKALEFYEKLLDEVLERLGLAKRKEVVLNG